MKNTTKEYLDKLRVQSFKIESEDEVEKEINVVILDSAEQLIQDFEVALLNEIQEQKIKSLLAEKHK